MKTWQLIVSALAAFLIPGQTFAQTVQLSHSASMDVTENGISCGNSDTGITAENHYWRVFDLTEFGVTNDYTITSVDVGIGDLDLRGTAQPSTLRIHEVSGDFLLANLALRHEQNLILEDGLALTLQNVSIDNITVEVGKTFAVEWEPIDGTPSNDHGPLETGFGANSAGQTGPTFIYAPTCGDTEPMDLATVGTGFPNSHWVVAVNGVVSTAVEDVMVPQTYELLGNYPNPYNPTTTISYALPKAAYVTLRVADILGRIVRELASGMQPAGTYEVSFDAAGLPSGVYVYRLEAAGFAETRTMVVLK